MDITIYKLTNVINGMGYVGATKNFKRRMGEHHWNYGDKRKIRTLVDKAIREYGWENFTVEILEVCDAEVAPERESHWIKELNMLEPNGYNCTTGGNKGTKFTSNVSMRLSASLIERTVFPVLQAELDKQQMPRHVFAQKLGFATITVSAWMTGKCEPKLSSAIKVKEVLGVDIPLEELFAKTARD